MPTGVFPEYLTVFQRFGHSPCANFENEKETQSQQQSDTGFLLVDRRISQKVTKLRSRKHIVLVLVVLEAGRLPP